MTCADQPWRWAVGRGLWAVGCGLARPPARSARAARAARAARGQLGLVALSRTTPLPPPPIHGSPWCLRLCKLNLHLPGTTPSLLFAPSASRPPTVKPQSRQNTHHPSQPCLADLFGDPRLLLKWGPAMRAAVLLHSGFDLLSRGLTLASACCQ